MRVQAIQHHLIKVCLREIGCLHHSIIILTHRRPAPSRRPDKLNVHIICHSHDDPGWLKTVDQYFIGSNQHIQVAGVRSILDSVMRELLDNPDRRFSYGEMV